MVCLLTLLAAPAAKAAPSVTYECTPAPQDCSGWYRSDVSVDWTVVATDESVVTGESRVSFAIEAGRPQTRTLYHWTYPEQREKFNNWIVARLKNGND